MKAGNEKFSSPHLYERWIEIHYRVQSNIVITIWRVESGNNSNMIYREADFFFNERKKYILLLNLRELNTLSHFIRN